MFLRNHKQQLHMIEGKNSKNLYSCFVLTSSQKERDDVRCIIYVFTGSNKYSADDNCSGSVKCTLDRALSMARLRAVETILLLDKTLSSHKKLLHFPLIS